MHRALDFMKTLSEERRLRIVMLLSRQDELCVTDMVMLLAAPQYAVSHALADLKKAGIVTCRKTSRQVFYSLTHERRGLIEQVLGSLQQEFPDEHFQPITSVASYHRILAV